MLLCFASIAFSQEQNMQTIILKNGKEITGTILESKNNKIVKIRTSSTILQIKTKTIDRIIDSKQTDKTILENPIKFKQRGFFIMLEGGITNIIDSYEVEINESDPIYTNDIIEYTPKNYYEFNIVAGYKFKPYFTIGFSTGLEHVGGENLIPISLYLRSELLKTRLTPFIDMRFGAILGMSDIIDFGTGISGGAGLKINITKNTALNISGGLKFANLWTEINTPLETINEGDFLTEDNGYANPTFISFSNYLRLGINF